MFKVKVIKSFADKKSGEITFLTETEYLKHKSNLMLISFIPCNMKVNNLYTK